MVFHSLWRIGGELPIFVIFPCLCYVLIFLFLIVVGMLAFYDFLTFSFIFTSLLDGCSDYI